MSKNQDIIDMLDVLKLPIAVSRFRELMDSPELGGYSPVQFLRELLTDQYHETLNTRFETNLRSGSRRTGRTSGCTASLEPGNHTSCLRAA